MMRSSRYLLVALFTFAAGCDRPPAIEEAPGGTCESYGTPCICGDGRTECAPHSTGVCPCGDELIDDEPPAAAPSDDTAADEVNATAEPDDESGAAANPSRGPRMNLEYAGCTSSDECIALRQPCFTVAIRRDKQEDYLESERGVQYRCPRPRDAGREVSAVCRAGRCEVVAANPAPE